MTGWVPLLKAVRISHPERLPPGESMIGTVRVLGRRGEVTVWEEIAYWDPASFYAYAAEEVLALASLRGHMSVQIATVQREVGNPALDHDA
jgi:hypothetical protein